MRTKVKICCIASIQEANMAIKYGADAIGLVGKMNAQKNPNQFTRYMGLARGYSAIGDYANALKNAQLALP